MKPKLACRRISNFSLMSVRCVSLRNAPCSRSRFLKGIVNIPSSWPIARAKAPRREREILGTSHRLVSSRRAGGRSPLRSSRVVKLTPPLLPLVATTVPQTWRSPPLMSGRPFPGCRFLTGNSGSERQRRGLMRRGVHNEPTTEPDLMSLTGVRSSHCFAFEESDPRIAEHQPHPKTRTNLA